MNTVVLSVIGAQQIQQVKIQNLCRGIFAILWIFYPFVAHCWRMDTAIKHPVPDWLKPSFVIF